MYVRYATKKFTQRSIEKWFERLTVDWESLFTAKELKLGRVLYRRGEVRELELGEDDAIVQCKWGKKETYSMIDWRNGKFEFRSSTMDRELGKAIAVAGFYEIEEMVIEEASPLPEFLKNMPREKEETFEPVKRTKKDLECRPLDLFLELNQQGLSLLARWKNPNGSFTHALKAAPKNHPPTAKEREQVIRLAGLARRCGFEFIKRKSVYCLQNLGLVPEFLSDTLPGWRKHFEVSMDALMEKKAKRVHEVELEVYADSGDEKLARLDWRMRANGRKLGDSETRQLFKRGKGLQFVENVGIVRMGERQGRIIREYKEVEQILPDGQMPRYLLLSLFGKDQLKVTLSRNLKSWETALEPKTMKKGVRLPKFLRDYQRHGVKWFSHLAEEGCHGLLADEMGLGKTVQVVTFVKKYAIKGKPTLIVCPASVVPVWQIEFEKWFPGTVVEVLRSNNPLSSKKGDTIWLASYTQLRRHKSLLADLDFGYTVLDEAQSIKNPDAKVSQACFSVKSDHRLALTGTPIENRQQDLWSIFRFLMPGLLGARRTFEENLENDPKLYLPRLNKQLSPFVLRRTKIEVATELPEKIETELICPMTQLQQKEYAKLTSEGIEELGSDMDQIVRQKNFTLFALLTRLRQTCCDPDLLPWQTAALEDSGKIMMLVEKLKDVLPSGHKVVVFSQFTTFLDRIKKSIKSQLPGYKIFELRGGTRNREKPVREFQECKDPAVMLISLKAGGTGITLHAADYVFLMDPWWNPAVEEQAVDRVHRIGQDKTVFVYRLITKGTIEEKMMELKRSKKDLFDQTIGDLKEITNIQSYYQNLGDLISFVSDK